LNLRNNLKGAFYFKCPTNNSYNKKSNPKSKSLRFSLKLRKKLLLLFRLKRNNQSLKRLKRNLLSPNQSLSSYLSLRRLNNKMSPRESNMMQMSQMSLQQPILPKIRRLKNVQSIAS
jgi:hypothetical protein